MSANNGVIRIGRKGLKKFAFGDNEPFEVDVVVAFQGWIAVDDGFRPEEKEGDTDRSIPTANMLEYHQAAVHYVESLGGGQVTVAEALEFMARLREQYDELAHFFRPKLREEPDSPDTSEEGSELRFSAEAS